jgi:hypothetical protein
LILSEGLRLSVLFPLSLSTTSVRLRLSLAFVYITAILPLPQYQVASYSNTLVPLLPSLAHAWGHHVTSWPSISPHFIQGKIQTPYAFLHYFTLSSFLISPQIPTAFLSFIDSQCTSIHNDLLILWMICFPDLETLW